MSNFKDEITLERATTEQNAAAATAAAAASLSLYAVVTTGLRLSLSRTLSHHWVLLCRCAVRKCACTRDPYSG
jgi:hypothetical protein